MYGLYAMATLDHDLEFIDTVREEEMECAETGIWLACSVQPNEDLLSSFEVL